MSNTCLCGQYRGVSDSVKLIPRYYLRHAKRGTANVVSRRRVSGTTTTGRHTIGTAGTRSTRPGARSSRDRRASGYLAPRWWAGVVWWLVLTGCRVLRYPPFIVRRGVGRVSYWEVVMSSVHVDLSRDAARWFGAVASVASRDSSRPVLSGVLIESGAVWSPILGDFVGATFTATDSYRLMTVAVRDDSAGSGSVLVPASVKVPARSGVTFSWDSDSLRENVGAAYADHLDRRDGAGAGDDLRPVVRVHTGDTSTTVTVPAAADTFPKWRGLLPGVGDDGAVEPEPYAVNPAYLGGLLVAMGKAAGKVGATNPVRCVASSANRPGLWEWCDDSAGVAACGLVMPVRCPGGVLGHRDRSVVSS